jgi:protein involved in polysaccharide export with SLBB domain/capsular polysaccharide biosynthesis protein
MLLDTWALADTVMKRWYWILLGAMVFAALGAAYGWHRWKPYYIGTAQLIRFDEKNSAEFFKYQEISQPTFVTILESPGLLESASRKAAPGITADDLASRLAVLPARESDVVTITVEAESAERAVSLVNCYVTNAVDYLKKLQKDDALKDNGYLSNQLAQITQDIKDKKDNLKALPKFDPLRSTGPSSTGQQLLTAQGDLDQALTKFTDEHPEVKAKKKLVAQLQQRLAQESTNAPPIVAAPGKTVETDSELLRLEIQMLENNRILLHTRQREAEQYSQNPPGYCRVFATAEMKDAIYIDPKMKIGFLGVMGAFGGITLIIALILLCELADNRVKTVTDLKRVARLPVIATLGDVNKMHPAEQASWAFRTWTAMQSRLSLSANHGMVCGFTSSAVGQGRSTWIRLLAKAASQCGFRVLTIATLPSPPFMQEDHKEHKEDGDMNVNGKHEEESPFGSEPSMAVMNNVLVTPNQVTEKLTGDHAEPQVHIPLPGWVWSLERRKQWQDALKQWRNIENIVILVELPPSSDPEAVLLAENIPNIVWLADSSSTDATDCREQLQTLRDARCNLVGTVMNRAPAAARMKKRFSRWVGVWPLLLSICLVSPSVRAQTNAPVTPAPPASSSSAAITNEPAFSGTSLRQRAEWQKRLTLGAGDSLAISMYGEPALLRPEVPIGPDGKLSYLQAADVLAAGLTVDELRARLDEELGKYYRMPRTMITPVLLRSKKYYVLGKVVNKGAYVLDRPLTILEAVARAQGLETGLLENQTSFELADLQRSFVMRGHKRLEVNLEKLFLEGDLSQNVPLEPEDYLYFAGANMKEVYVLGQVRNPGPATWTPGMGVVGAIAARMGYTDKAFKSRVLVVRGSLNRPQTFVVDTWAALDARGLDFELKPKDIVYVSTRPFIRVEEVLDLAASAFVQSMAASWGNAYIGPIILSPILPQP